MKNKSNQGGIISAGGKVVIRCGGKFINHGTIEGAEVDIQAAEIEDKGTIAAGKITAMLIPPHETTENILLGDTANYEDQGTDLHSINNEAL